MSGTRRKFFQDAAVFGAGLFGLRETLHAGTPESTRQSPRENENGRHHSPYGSHGPHPAQARALHRADLNRQRRFQPAQNALDRGAFAERHLPDAIIKDVDGHGRIIERL